MPIPYRTKVNKRNIGSELSIIAEQHVVGISGAFTSTPNKIRLVEVPLQEMPSTVTIPGFTEVTTAPGAFEFVVDYGIGRLTFNAARSGETVFVSYKGRGSEVDSEDVNELQLPLDVIATSNGITTTLAVGIVKPNNISSIVTDDFVFPRHVLATNDLTAGEDIFGGGILTVDSHITSTNGNLSAGGTTLSLNTAQVGAPTLDGYLTMERGSSGDVSLKWNETIDAWEFLNDVGSPIFQIYNTGTLSFVGPLTIGDGTISNPAYSFTSEPDLGFYKVSSGVIAFVNASAPTLTISSSFIQSHFQHLLTSGTVAAPGIAFDSEATGWYLAGLNNPALSVAGVNTLDVNVPTGYLTSALRFLVPSGTTLLPSLSFTTDPNTGLHNSAPDQLDVALGGITTVNFMASAVNSFVKFQAPDGTPLAPSYTFTSLPGSGMTSDFGNLTFSVDGFGEAGRFSTVGDFHIQSGRRVVFDGVAGNASIRYLLDGLVAQSNTDSSLALRSPSYFSLESNAFATGNAFSLVRVMDYSGLLTDTITINGTTLTEGIDWFAATDNTTTATSIVDAINNDPALLGVVTASSDSNVITILAFVAGEASESITVVTSDPTNLLLYSPTLQGGGAANTNEPSIAMNVNGSIDVLNSSQGNESDRALSIRMTQEMGMGYHRTFKVTPKDVGVGTAATARVVVFDYTMLTGATLTVAGIVLTEGIDWDAEISNNTTAFNLAAAIDSLTTVSAVDGGNVITITSEIFGAIGNTYNLITSDPMNLITSGSFLHDGADDFVLAFGYESDGTDVVAATIDSHGSLPISVTIDDTEVVRVSDSLVTVQQPMNIANNQIHAVADPTSPQDAATKAYVDSVAAGFDPKASVRTASTADIDLTTGGLLTIDGITVVDNDRVLVKNQTDPLENGIYNAHAGSWTRSTDMDGTPANEVSGGNFTFVEQGTVQVGTGWVVLGDGILTIGVDNINWTQFSHSGIATSFNTMVGDPGSPVAAQVWFDTVTSQFKGYNGTSIVILG